MVDLAAALDVTPSTAGRMCDRLLRKGLIRRHRARADRRAVQVSITAAGRQVVDHATDRRRSLIAGILGRLPTAQQAEVAGALAGVRRRRRGDPRQPVASRSAGGRPTSARMKREPARCGSTRDGHDGRGGGGLPAGAGRWTGRASGWCGSRAGLLAIALVVGAGSGLGAVAFRSLIYFFTWLATGHVQFGQQGRVPSAHFPGLGLGFFVVIPVIGGLIYGPLIYRYAREARGHGVPEVMIAVAEEGGRIRPQVAAVKSVASAICIGVGGSVGREGPIVQIGSALASSLGQWVKMPESRLRILVACGARRDRRHVQRADHRGVLRGGDHLAGSPSRRSSPLSAPSAMASRRSRAATARARPCSAGLNAAPMRMTSARSSTWRSRPCGSAPPGAGTVV